MTRLEHIKVTRLTCTVEVSAVELGLVGYHYLNYGRPATDQEFRTWMDHLITHEFETLRGHRHHDEQDTTS
jgi:hypothetical protein